MLCVGQYRPRYANADLQVRCNLIPMARLRPGYALAPASGGETFEADAGLATAPADARRARRARRLTWNLMG